MVEASPSELVVGKPSLADPKHCKVHGSGLRSASVRKANEFTIQACDSAGEEMKVGGDQFFIAIRGRGVRVRARVTDNGDGSYSVSWNPYLAGAYKINISMLGEPLPGSPFHCVAQTSGPCAAQCVVRGEALQQAVARLQQTFEITFKDANGQVTHAEDLDVYVEPVTASTAIPDITAETGSNGMADISQQNNAGAGEMSGSFRSASSSDLLGASSTSLATAPAAELKGGQVRISLPFEGWKRKWARECVSNRPLVVRAAEAVDSDRVGQILPGRRIYLLKENLVGTTTRALAAVDLGPAENTEEGMVVSRSSSEIMSNGLSSVRALSSTRSPSPTKDDSWLSTYVSKPAWLGYDEEVAVATARGNAQMPCTPRTPRTPRGNNKVIFEARIVGWVTVAKEGRELVSTATALGATERQQHMQAWARRKAVDKSIAHVIRVPAKTKRGADDGGISRKSRGDEAQRGGTIKNPYTSELFGDPTKIGFAFGGVEPGRLHAHGRIVESHKVFYSICLVGTYRLHVGLRNQNVPIPGSPFTLHVVPGEAHAASTALPADTPLPLQGVVGFDDEQGCHLIFRVSDKMCNPCAEGGAKVAATCLGEEKGVVIAEVKDRADGTYEAIWRSKQSGHFEVQLTVDGMPIIGSPFKLQLQSTTPDLARTVASGKGLSEIRAGSPAPVTLCLLDQYDNSASKGQNLDFGIFIVKADANKEEKNKWKTAPSFAYVGSVVPEGYQLTYTPELAGAMEIHLWACEKQAEEKSQARELPREELPGSPFMLICSSGDANASNSGMDGFSKAAPEVTAKETSKKSAQQSVPAAPMPGSMSRAERIHTFPSGSEVGAGEILVFKPTIYDQYDNPAAAKDGTLKFELISPDGVASLLDVLTHAKSGLTSYEARFEPKNQGEYHLHISIAGIPIQNSPLSFVVLSGFPDAHKSFFETPEGPLFSMVEYEFTLVTTDKWSNRCSKGGAHVSGRISSHSLPAGQETELEVIDLHDGRYVFKIMLRAPADVKCLVTIAREKPNPSAGAAAVPVTEMPPVSLSFISEKAQQLKEERARKAAMQGGSSDAMKLLRSNTSMSISAVQEAAAGWSADAPPKPPSVASSSTTPQASVRPHVPDALPQPALKKQGSSHRLGSPDAFADAASGAMKAFAEDASATASPEPLQNMEDQKQRGKIEDSPPE